MANDAGQQMRSEPGAVTLRPVTPDDEAFLLRVYASTREQELAAVPWDDAQREAFVRFQFAAQSQFYQTEYPDAQHHLILQGDQPVGRLYVHHRANEIRILDLTLLAEHRGAGLGAPLIRRLMNEAARAGLPLTIHVESFNRSRRLFERLGFVPVAENGLHTLFEWRAGGSVR
ncbi:MAG TPA: GNAT family N-acetyltransferase [Blastocatellia bacterium]|nr:GNAT family N-acetyltransferase [Blastocatellia bacterium]